MLNSEKTTKAILFATSTLIILISSGMVITLLGGAIPAFTKFGIGFIFSSEWNPTQGAEIYGALTFIVGTFLTSIIALIICLPLSFSVSLFIGEYYKGTKIAKYVKTMINLLAGIPSIVYGLWGIYVLRPWLVDIGFVGQCYCILTAAIILSIMIIPFAASISSEIIMLVSNDLKEAAYSLGATKKDVILKVIIPNAKSGIFTSYILAFGRAIGETMAVTMLIGNSNTLPTSIFQAGNTMASVIANQFGEADGLKLSSLIAIALLLFVITGLINGFGKLIIRRV